MISLPFCSLDELIRTDYFVVPHVSSSSLFIETKSSRFVCARRSKMPAKLDCASGQLLVRRTPRRAASSLELPHSSAHQAGRKNFPRIFIPLLVFNFYAEGGILVETPPSPPVCPDAQKQRRRFAKQAQVDSCSVKQNAQNASHETMMQVTALCRQNAKGLALDLGVVLHGEVAGELPESVLGVLRIEGLDLQDTARHRLLWES